MPKSVQQAKILTSTQAAYIAGIIDGEGCFSIMLDRGYLKGSLQIGSVNKEFLHSLVKIVGAGTTCSKKQRTKNSKILHVWTIQLTALAGLLPQLMPYLMLKKPQAEIALLLVQYPKPTVVRDNFQLESLKSLKILNQRGTAVLCN